MNNEKDTFLWPTSFDIYNSKLWIVDNVKDGMAISTGVSKNKKTAEKDALENKTYAKVLKDFNPFTEKNIKSLPQYQSLIQTLLTREIRSDYEFLPLYFPEINSTLCIIVKTNELENDWYYFSNDNGDIPEQIRDIIFQFYKTPLKMNTVDNNRNIKLYEWLKLWYARLEVWKG